MIKKALFSFIVLAVVIFAVKLMWFSGSRNNSAGRQMADCETQKQEFFEKHLKEIYTQTGLDTAGLNYDVYRKGMIGFYNLENDTQVNKPVLSIVDFNKPSTDKRLYIFDVKERKLLFHSLVAHGRNTGENTAEDFSNLANSNKSSIGFYVTQNTYQGKHGLSLVINGMEKGWNDSAKARSIVVHGAEYVSDDYVENVGRCGRSQGCPAIPQAICSGVVCTISDRSVLFIYYPDQKYLSESIYLKEEPALETYAFNSFFRCTKYTELALR
ncbi:MAG: murein L,D-transpeptidase catalytic domain family protein [Sphingobacteriales bacterium]|nr:MAG: murein L,D-transpeptidase catalytic domain family protein [Sphingobacteriales bacterium]